MSDVQETQLPGVGVRYDFLTSEAIDRRAGPPFRSSRATAVRPWRSRLQSPIARLDPDDADTLADLLGVPDISQQLEGSPTTHRGPGDRLDADRQGLLVRWTDMRRCAIHTRTSVSIVAVLRGTQAYPAPTADFVLEPDDIAVASAPPPASRHCTNYAAGNDPARAAQDAVRIPVSCWSNWGC